MPETPQEKAPPEPTTTSRSAPPSPPGPGSGPPASPPAPPSPPAKPGWAAGLRELMTALIAAVIVLVSGWMLVVTFQDAGAVSGLDPPQLEARKPLLEQAFAQRKDVMLYALSLLGTVLGYYFGRVPAERRAEKAEEARGEAQASANQAVGRAAAVESKMEDAKATAVRARAVLQSAASATPRRRTRTLAEGAGEAEGAAPEVLSAIHEFEGLIQRL